MNVLHIPSQISSQHYQSDLLEHCEETSLSLQNFFFMEHKVPLLSDNVSQLRGVHR